MKLWLYQFYILSSLSWSFTVQDFSLSFAIELQDTMTATLKKWVGLFKSSDPGALYRPKSMLGLGLTPISTHFKKMQLIKCHLCKHSADIEVQAIYESRAEKESKFATVWRGSQLLAEVENRVDFNLKFPGQDDRCGIGFIKNRFNPKPSLSDHRKLCVSTVSDIAAHDYFTHAHTLEMQGIWTKWLDKAIPFDFSWHNLIYGPGTRLIAFVINASINSHSSPALLHLMGYQPLADCYLCGKKQCTLFHILVNCTYSLHNKRYTWMSYYI